MLVMHATAVPPPTLRREPTEVGEAFSYRWMESGHVACSVAAVVMAWVVCAVGAGAWHEPGDVGLILSVFVLLLADLTMIWAAAAGIFNRTTVTFGPDCLWLRHGPVAIVHRGRVYSRTELRDFVVREIVYRSRRSTFYRYVLTVSTLDGRIVNLTRELKPYYRPAITHIASYGNVWLAPADGTARAIHDDQVLTGIAN